MDDTPVTAGDVVCGGAYMLLIKNNGKHVLRQATHPMLSNLSHAVFYYIANRRPTRSTRLTRSSRFRSIPFPGERAVPATRVLSQQYLRCRSCLFKYVVFRLGDEEGSG
jgi:hypothetical protein